MANFTVRQYDKLAKHISIAILTGSRRDTPNEEASRSGSALILMTAGRSGAVNIPPVPILANVK